MAEPDFDDAERRERENRTLLQRLSGFAFGTPAPRPAEQEVTDEVRKARIASTMNAFLAHREAYVRSLLASEQVSPETTYALGEAIYAYFRHRQILLSSAELRELAAPVIEQWNSTAQSPPGEPDTEKPQTVETAPVPEAGTGNADLQDRQLQEIAPPAENALVLSTVPAIAIADRLRVVHDATAESSPQLSSASIVSPAAFQSRLRPHNDQVSEGTAPPAADNIALASAQADQQDVLVARCLALVEESVGPSRASSARPKVLAAIDAALDQIQRELPEPMAGETRETLYKAVAAEILGLGIIGRIWEDTSVQSIFVNGAHSIFVERNGTVAPVATSFRDDAHLLNFVKRIGVATDRVVSEVHLPNGGKCIAIFPPASPSGPVFTFHRGTAAGATLAGLITADMIDERIASLLRLAATAGLTTAVVGPRKSGKTTLLSALCTDLGDKTRVVTVSRSRDLLSNQQGRVELVTSDVAPLPTLLRYAQLIGPEVLVVDGAESGDMPAVADLDRSAMKGFLVTLDDGERLGAKTLAADIVVRMGWGRDSQLRALLLHDAQGAPVIVYEDGRFKLVNACPAFAEKVRSTDQAAALAALTN
jgi:type IV secretory pathway ATPase VirB11/archaellum biosynthesis ATPase